MSRFSCLSPARSAQHGATQNGQLRAASLHAGGASRKATMRHPRGTAPARSAERRGRDHSPFAVARHARQAAYKRFKIRIRGGLGSTMPEWPRSIRAERRWQMRWHKRHPFKAREKIRRRLRRGVLPARGFVCPVGVL